MLSSRGDILINRDLRGELSKETPELFFRNVKLSQDDCPPIFNIEGVSYIFLHCNSVYVVATSRFNISPLTVIDLLKQLTVTIKDFCGNFSEDSLRKNFVLVYEIIEEMLDFGFPQASSSEQIRDFIVSIPQTEAKSFLDKQFFQTSTIKAKASQNPITTFKERNEVFIDVIEQIIVLFNSSNSIISSYVNGCVRVKSYLTGTPKLSMTFSDEANLSNISFHETVDDSQFKNSRSLALTPLIGESCIMRYRLKDGFVVPFKIFPFLNLESPYKLEILLKIRSEYPKDISAKSITIRFKLPEVMSSVNFELEKDSKSEKATHKESLKEVEWKIEGLQGDTERSLTTKISLLKEVSMYQLRKDIGPIKLSFEMNQMNLSGLKLPKVDLDGTDIEKPKKWIRYISNSDSYVVRL